MTLRQRASRTPAGRAVAPLLLVAVLSTGACGSDESSGDSSGGGSGGSASSIEDVGDEIGGTIGIAAEQIGKRLKASGAELEGTTLTFSFDEDPAEDGSASPTDTALGGCQIARTVLDSVVSGEVETLKMKYPSSTVDCAEYS